MKTYKELSKLKTFMERYLYLQVKGRVGEETFGYDRYLNQMLYTSKKWKRTRDEIIIRDGACDLGIEGRDIFGRIVIHHMNILTIEDIENDIDEIYEPELLITTCHDTHMAIHYGDINLLPKDPIIRTKYDTCPWKERR